MTIIYENDGLKLVSNKGRFLFYVFSCWPVDGEEHDLTLRGRDQHLLWAMTMK